MTVKYNPVGDQIPTVLSTAVQGGNPPDLAAVAQPGLVRDFVEKNALKPLDFAESTINDNFSEGAVEAGTVDGKPYGVLFKAANKSTVWYNVPLFEEAGVEPPEDFDAFLEAAKTLRASGTKAYSIGASDGWTLTDMFENIYLRQAGPEKYDQLATHDIPWTDQSVKDALEDDGADRRRHGQHRGRHLRRARDRLPDVGHQRVQGQPRRRAGARGRLRGERDHRFHAGQAGDGLQRLRLPGDRRLRSIGGRWW